MSSSAPHHIPKEITLQFCNMSSTKTAEHSRLMFPQHTETAGRPNSQTVCDGDIKVESSFNGGISSLSSGNDSYNNLPNMIPLDFRVERSNEDYESLEHNVSQNISFFISETSMEVDSLCELNSEWRMESICGDSLDTEEDMGSIRECIDSENEDFWDLSLI